MRLRTSGFVLPVFSGMIAPLEMFPEHVRKWCFGLRSHLIHFPAALLIGLPVDSARFFGDLRLGSAIFLFFEPRLWRRGLKQYSGMGSLGDI